MPFARESLARDVTTVGSATLLSRLLAFARDMGIAAALGTGVFADAYFSALQIPNLFRRLLAEGALNSAFVPAWLRIRDEGGPEAARRFAAGAFVTLAAALLVVALAAALFAPAVVRLLAPGFDPDGERFQWAVVFVRLGAPYIVLAGMVAVAASVLNASGRVAAAAFGNVVFNIVLVAAVVFVVVRQDGLPITAGAFLSLAVVAAGVAQLVVVGGALLRSAERPGRPAPSADAVRFLRQALPGVVAAGIPQLTLMAGAMVASSSPAAVAWLYYANRLYELPLGVVSIVVASVMAPMIAAHLRIGAGDDVAAAQSRAMEIAVGLALPSAVALVILAEPIAGGLFQRGAFSAHDTAMVAAALAAMSAGLPGHVIEKVFAAVSFAHEDTRTPMTTALCGLAAAAFGALALFPAYGHVGVAAAIAGSGWVGAALLGTILMRRRWLAFDRLARRRLPLLFGAAALMGGAILLGHGTLGGWFDITGSSLARLSSLAVLVVGGLSVYVMALQVLGVASVAGILASLRGQS
jgi:putative peptidoglycan lipid II flippase